MLCKHTTDDSAVSWVTLRVAASMIHIWFMLHCNHVLCAEVTLCEMRGDRRKTTGKCCSALQKL